MPSLPQLYKKFQVKYEFVFDYLSPIPSLWSITSFLRYHMKKFEKKGTVYRRSIHRGGNYIDSFDKLWLFAESCKN